MTKVYLASFCSKQAYHKNVKIGSSSISSLLLFVSVFTFLSFLLILGFFLEKFGSDDLQKLLNLFVAQSFLAVFDQKLDLNGRLEIKQSQTIRTSAGRFRLRVDAKKLL